MKQNARILVVDDEQDLLEILKFNLETEGYEVVTAPSAEDALQLLRRSALDVVEQVFLRVGFQIDLPQIFVQLRQRELERGFHRVDIHRRERGARSVSSNAELVFKHEFHQLHQNAVLAVENVLKTAGGDLRLL